MFSSSFCGPIPNAMVMQSGVVLVFGRALNISIPISFAPPTTPRFQNSDLKNHRDEHQLVR